MKHNNKSIYFKDWTTAKLKSEAIGYYNAIYVDECYGTGDMSAYVGILNELKKRGITPREQLIF